MRARLRSLAAHLELALLGTGMLSLVIGVARASVFFAAVHYALFTALTTIVSWSCAARAYQLCSGAAGGRVRVAAGAAGTIVYIGTFLAGALLFGLSWDAAFYRADLDLASTQPKVEQLIRAWNLTAEQPPWWPRGDDVLVIGSGPLSVHQRALIRTVAADKVWRMNGLTNLHAKEPVGNVVLRSVGPNGTEPYMGLRTGSPNLFWGLEFPFKLKTLLYRVPSLRVTMPLCPRLREAVSTHLVFATPDDLAYYRRRDGIDARIFGCDQGARRQLLEPPQALGSLSTGMILIKCRLAVAQADGDAANASRAKSGKLGTLNPSGPRVHVLGFNWNSPTHTVPGMDAGDHQSGAHSGAYEKELVKALRLRHGKRLVVHRTPTKNYHARVPARFGGGEWELGLGCGVWHPVWMSICRWPPTHLVSFIVGLGGLGVVLGVGLRVASRSG